MEQHYFKNFRRVNEAVHPESLNPDELQYLVNMRLDNEIAAAESRKGFSRYGSQVNSNGAITSIFDVEDEDGNNYLLAQIGTVLRKSLDGSGAYSTFKTGLTNSKLRMAIYGDKFLFTNNNEAPFYSDLTNNYSMFVERPDTSSMVLTPHAAGSNLTDGILRYLVVYVTTDGQKSSPSLEVQTFEQGHDNDYYTITGIPVSVDSRVTKKIIYRTAANILNVYYQLTVLDNATTSFVDQTPDADLGAAEDIIYLNTPNKSKFIAVNSERIFLANITKTLKNIVIPPSRVSLAYATNTVGTGTTILAGDYKYGASFIDAFGNESELVEFLDYTLGANSDQINVYLFPLPNITLEEYRNDVSLVRIYRTKKDSSTFYKLADLTLASYQQQYPNTSVSIGDLVADAALTDEYPTGTEYLPTSVSELKSTVVFSEPYKYYELPELNLIQVYPDDNDPISGIFDDDNGIIVFKDRSICKIYTNGDPSNWQVQKLVEDIGCDQPNSIYKYGTDYFFYYKNRPYLFNGRSTKPIGESFRDTFDSVTAINGATFWHDAQFYILAVNIGSSYYLLAYDTKLDGWYKWTISKADDITIKLFGSDKGKLLFGRNTYITYYNESIDYDNDSGSRADINVSLKTKDFLVDGFVNMRLWMLFLDYRKRLNRTTDAIIFTLTDPSKTTVNSYNDNFSTIIINKFKMPTDAMVGALKRARSINFSFSGYSMDKFINGRLDYMPERWGVERRSPGQTTGLGISHGSEAGISD